MKQDFLNYVKDTFAFSAETMQVFSTALSKPLKKTLRVNTNKISIENFQAQALKNNWTLGKTPLGKNMFYIDREDTSLPLGHTLEHISGYFYVQELAASSSPFYLSDDTVDRNEYSILDMSASPGGKTTQLAEYYPNSIIIANEIDKTRMRQLYENTDRLGAKNVFVTNFDGRFFGNYPEIFDKVLLDAPCSGEGTAYKNDDALKYWNIKNIKRIAKLQTQLLESALISLKIGGELVYSTCTINQLENEEIIHSILEKYPHQVEILPLDHANSQEGYIRAWPHLTGTGGFFVVKLRKTGSITKIQESQKKLQKHTQGFEKVSPTDEKEIERFLEQCFQLSLSGKLYTYRNEIYFTEKNIDFFWENFFFYKCGIKIGSFENGTFTPNYYLGSHFGVFQKNSITLTQDEIDKLLKGEEIKIPREDTYYQIICQDILTGIIKVKSQKAQSLLETKFMRK